MLDVISLHLFEKLQNNLFNLFNWFILIVNTPEDSSGNLVQVLKLMAKLCCNVNLCHDIEYNYLKKTLRQDRWAMVVMHREATCFFLCEVVDGCDNLHVQIWASMD